MLTRAITLFACFVLAAVIIGRAAASEAPVSRVSLSAFPMDMDQWRGRQEPAFDAKTLETLGVDDYLTRSYAHPGTVAGLYIGYWATQSQGDTIHSPLNCLPGSGWEPLSKRTLMLNVATSNPGQPERLIGINRYVIQKGLDRQLVLYWYQSHGRVVASEYLGKFYLVTDAIRTRRTDAALVRVIVRIPDEPDGESRAEREGVRFVESLFPRLTTYLPS